MLLLKKVWSAQCLNWSIVTRARAPRQVTPGFMDQFGCPLSRDLDRMELAGTGGPPGGSSFTVLAGPRKGEASRGRRCHSTLSLAAIGCHPLRNYTLILLSLLSFLSK